jgi:hypothetical protein
MSGTCFSEHKQKQIFVRLCGLLSLALHFLSLLLRVRFFPEHTLASSDEEEKKEPTAQTTNMLIDFFRHSNRALFARHLAMRAFLGAQFTPLFPTPLTPISFVDIMLLLIRVFLKLPDNVALIFLFRAING